MSNGYVDIFERNGTTANMHDTDLRNTIGQANGLAQLDSNGKLPSNVVPSDTTKADKVINPTNGNLAKLDANGNLADSGIASSTLDAITNVYGSKNLFPDFVESQTYKGITWTRNADTSITVNGTADGWSTLAYSSSIKLKAGTYILSSGLAWPACYDVYVELNYNDGTSHVINTSQAEEVTFTLANDTTIPTVQVVVRSNKTVSNITIKPMLRDARISDSTYVPYSMTNRELMEKKADKYSIAFISSGIFHGSSVTVSPFIIPEGSFSFQYNNSSWGNTKYLHFKPTGPYSDISFTIYGRNTNINCIYSTDEDKLIYGIVGYSADGTAISNTYWYRSSDNQIATWVISPYSYSVFIGFTGGAEVWVDDNPNT